MAKGDFIVAKVTPRANEVNLESVESSKNMPAIKYFAASYDPGLILRDDEGNNLGVKTPWFSETTPSGADPEEYKIYGEPTLRNMPLKNDDRSDMEFDSAQEAENHANERGINGVLKYEENNKFKILCCDINPAQVVGGPRDDNGPLEIRITLEKRVNRYNKGYVDSDGALLEASNANVFYILDEEWNILAVIHAYGFTFKGLDRWEIVQHLIYQHDVAVTDIIEDPDPFYFKTAAEILLPDEIIGDAVDKDAGKASRVIENFDPASSAASVLKNGDLNNKRTLFLETAGPLAGSIERVDENARFDMENPRAALDLNGHSLTLGGSVLRGYLSIVDNAGGGSLKISGERAALRLSLSGISDNALKVSGTGVNLDITTDNEKVSDFSGTGKCVVNGRIYLRRNADILGNLEVSGDIAGRHITTEGKLEVKSKDGVSDSGNAVIEGNLAVSGGITGRDITTAGGVEIGGGLKLNGSQNLDMGGASLVNCRTISELFKDGLVCFDGENHYAEIPDNNYLNFGADQGFSLLLAFRTDRDNGSPAFLLSKGQDGNNAYYRLYLDSDNQLTAEIKADGSTASARSGRPANDGRIHAALVRCDRAGNLELYLDGIPAGASDISSLSGEISNDQSLVLARDGEAAPGKHFKGEMFVIRVWDYLLPQEEAVELSANPHSPAKFSTNYNNDIYLNDFNNWQTSGLHVFRSQNVHVNNSAEAFEFVNKGGACLLAYIDLNPLNLKIGQKYRLQLDVKHTGTSYAWYGGLTASGNLLFYSGTSELFLINNANQVTIFPRRQGSATSGAVIHSYSNGFQRLAFEFTHTENTRYLSFDGASTGGGIYLDNVFLYTYSSSQYGKYLALSSEGLGESDRWLDSGPNQLHATLNAEVMKNRRHAGDLEVTGNITAKSMELTHNAGDGLFLRVAKDIETKNVELFDGHKSSLLINARSTLDMVQGGLWMSDDAHIEINDYNSDDLNFYEDEDFSFLTVFRTSKNYSGGRGYLLNKGLSGEGRYSLYIDTDNRLAAELKDADSNSTILKSDSGKAINNSQAHAALVRCDRRGEIRMYLDGALQGDVKTDNSKSLWNNRHLYLGQDGAGSGGFMGELFMVRIWNRLLSFEEAVAHSSNPSSTLGYGDALAKELHTNSSIAAYGSEGISMGSWRQNNLYTTCYQTLITKGNYGFRLHERAHRVYGLTSASRLYRNINDWLRPPHRYRLKFDWRHFQNGGDFACELGWDNTGNNQRIATISSNQSCAVSGREPNIEGIRITRSGQSAVNSVGSYPSGTYGTTPLTRVSVEFELTSSSHAEKYLVFRERKGSASAYGSIFLDSVSCRSLGCCLDLSGKTLNSSSASWPDNSANKRDCVFKGTSKPQPF